MHEFRKKTAYWLNTGALVLLALSVLFLIRMWVRAYIEGSIPQGAWGQYEGNHGPWRERIFLMPWARHGLRWLWWQVLNLQLFAFVIGFISILFKPSKKAVIAACSAFVLGCLFFVTHYWLVD
ncbi:MAG: hypothetical protein PHW54_06825 [Candidatus Omnitrophica bacterium]|jgi:hypothetical protein|nr:hypothetical protein [Candidatus Omnitrophota bacterium]